MYIQDGSKTKPTRTSKPNYYDRITSPNYTTNGPPIPSTSGVAVHKCASPFPAPSSHATLVLSLIQICTQTRFCHNMTLMHQITPSLSRFIRSHSTSASPLQQPLSSITIQCAHYHHIGVQCKSFIFDTAGCSRQPRLPFIAQETSPLIPRATSCFQLASPVTTLN